jgi:hypothetical protein
MKQWLAVLAFAASAPITAAEIPPEKVISACRSDAVRFCTVEAMSGDHSKIGACMRRHGSLLSHGCKTAVREWDNARSDR